MNLKPITILYEDRNVLVVNKPAGIVVHADGRTDEPTLVDWILKHYPKIRGVGEPIQDSRPHDAVGQARFMNQESMAFSRSGIVHRIDRETSGVLAVAKNQKTFLSLKKQFQDREVEKSYRAFVYGEMKGDEGTINRPIARSRKDFRLWSAQRGGRGQEREAITEYKVLARSNPFQSDSFGLARHKGFSFLEINPKTGRTHQIRVHLKAINHPVVCDKLYAPKRDCAMGFKRLALHAFFISFTLPSDKRIKVEAPYPSDFVSAIALLADFSERDS
ncbi:MAG: RluA family pseudouridine synthase [bacterium]|nr:RluA family pseudouridine synthase [bacterium]